MLFTPKSELDNRIKALQTRLAQKDIAGALIVQNIDLFYFSGTAQNAHLYVPVEGEPLLLVRKSFPRAKEESALANIVPLTSLKKLPQLLTDAGYSVPATLGLEFDLLPVANYMLYQQIFNEAKLMDISSIIRQVRQSKSTYEIDLLRNSGRKMTKIYNKIPSLIKEGMSDIELAGQIEGLARSAGHMGYVHMRAFNQAPYFGHLMSGAACAVPSAFDGPTGGPGLTPVHPEGAGTKPISKGEPILVDYVGLWEGYITDRTRLFSLGPLPSKLMDAFAIALEIQNETVARMKPGANGSDLHELSLEIAAKAGLGEHFMGYGADQARFLGHGIGLELDELPVLAKGINTILEPGMVIAVEPKFTFPDAGVVGIENTFVITDRGVEKLTDSPDDLVII